LAELLVETSQRMGKKTVALITDMDQPLGLRIGNSLEVEECADILHGRGPADLRDLSLELAAWMFHLGGRATTVPEGKDLADRMIRSGQALETFCKMVSLQGGDPATIENPSRLPRAKHRSVIPSARSGYVSAIQCEDVGTACVVLGGGRETKEDRVDPAVGIVLHKKLGDRVSAGEPLCTLVYNSASRAAKAKKLMERSFHVADAPPPLRPLIHRVVGKPDAQETF
jgi:thymidine phosphorylase